MKGRDGLWRRVYPERVPAIEAELAEARDELVVSRQADDAEVEKELAAEWRRKFQRLTTLVVHQAAGIGYQVSEPTFSPDGRTIAVSDDLGMIHLVDLPGKRAAATLTAEKIYNADPNGLTTMAVDSVTFSPDGKTLVTSDDADSTLAVWDVASGRQVATLNAGAGNVAAAAFTSSGKLIVATTSSSAASDRIEIWTTGALRS